MDGQLTADEKELIREATAATQEARATVRNISTVALLNLAQFPFLIASTMLVPRIMGPEIYGKYALLLSIFAIALSFIDLGESYAFRRFIPEFEVRREPANTTKLFSTFLALKGVIDLVACVLVFGISSSLYGDQFSPAYFVLLCAALFASDWGTIPHSLLFGLNELGKFALRNLLKRVLNLITILVLFNAYGLLGAMIALLIVESSLACLNGFWTRKYFNLRHCKIDVQFLKPYLLFGLSFYASWVLLNIRQRVGNSLIEHITNSSREVALFDIANQISLIVANCFFMIIESLAPTFTQLHLTQKEEKLVTWSTILIKYTTALGTVIFWISVLTGPALFSFIIGPKYEGVFLNVSVLLLGLFPLTLAKLGVTFSIIYKEPKYYIRALCFALVIFLAASVALIPKLDSLGCAVATVLSSIVLAAAMILQYKEKLLSCLGSGMKVITLGLIGAPFLFFKGDLVNNLFLALGFILTYLALLFASGVLDFSEVEEVFHSIRR